MTVKVHPHRSKVNQGIESCVSVTPDLRGGHVYYMGTVVLRNGGFRIYQSGVARARNVHAWAVGELADEWPEQCAYTPTEGVVQVTYHFNVGRFLTVENEPVDVTDGQFSAMLFVGRNFYVSKEW